MPSFKIPLAKTDVGPEELAAVERVMARGRLARGPEIDAFEAEFAAWVGARGGTMTNSGTSALVCALRAVGVRAGGEVIVPTLTFVGTANAVLGAGATPVLADVEPATGNIDATRLREAVSNRTQALVPVHLFGRPAAMDEISAVARELNLPIVEDAAEALGSELAGCRVGALGDAGIFGFYPNKLLTTGEGGMVVANDLEVIERCRALANQATDLDGPGYSFRGNELAAALGRAQLTTVDARLRERMALMAQYREMLADVGLAVFGDSAEPRGWFTCPVLLPSDVDRDAVRVELANAGVEAAAYFPALHTLPGMQRQAKTAGELHVGGELGARLLALPFWPGVEAHFPQIQAVLARAVRGNR